MNTKSQVKKAVVKWKKTLGLPSWPVFYQTHDEIGQSDNGVSCIAGIYVSDSDNEVWIHYRKDLADDAVNRVMCHEMVHWLLNDMQEYAEGYMPAKAQVFFRRMLDRSIERLAIALTGARQERPFRTH